MFLLHCETHGAWNIRTLSTTAPACPDTLHQDSPILRCPILHSLHSSSAAEGRQTAGRSARQHYSRAVRFFLQDRIKHTQDHWRGTWRGRTSGAHPETFLPETTLPMICNIMEPITLQLQFKHAPQHNPGQLDGGTTSSCRASRKHPGFLIQAKRIRNCPPSFTASVVPVLVSLDVVGPGFCCASS